MSEHYISLCTQSQSEHIAFLVPSCRNFDGGFGAVPGAESHAGQIFCCVAALSIGNALHHVDENLLGWWLSERQCDSGGLNGRPEKQADVCYSWWILSSLSILGRVSLLSRIACETSFVIHEVISWLVVLLTLYIASLMISIRPLGSTVTSWRTSS